MGIIATFKIWLRNNRKSDNPVIRYGIRSLDACVSFVRTVKGLLTDRNTRSIWYMKLFQRERTHQTTAATCLNRYPVIFSACREYFSGRESVKILSFGCATGEEVITLRHYFPSAEIVGAEINKNSLKVCRKLDLDDKIHFVDSLPEELQKHGPFDAIFCMAVFQRTPGLVSERNITDLSSIYPFDKFEKQIVELDRLLSESGLMIVHMSQYDFCDTSVYHGYEPYGDYHQNYYGPYVFGRDSKIKKKIAHRNSIFIKKTS